MISLSFSLPLSFLPLAIVKTQASCSWRFMARSWRDDEGKRRHYSDNCFIAFFVRTGNLRRELFDEELRDNFIYCP